MKATSASLLTVLGHEGRNRGLILCSETPLTSYGHETP
jgi:hypothetical protein